MNQPAIMAKNLWKQYYRQDALAGVSFQVEQGSIYGLLGPNGAGKTTTIQILMNLIAPSAGHAEVLGRPVSRLGWRDFRKIGYVSENQRLPEEMKVGELLDYLKPYYPTWDDSLCQELLTSA
jgi:ABC-2 type transport system ATP-binding protein